MILISKMDFIEEAKSLREDCFNGKCAIDSDQVMEVLMGLVPEKESPLELMSSFYCFFIGMLNEKKFIEKIDKMIDEDCDDVNEICDVIISLSMVVLPGDEETRIMKWMLSKCIKLKQLDVIIPASNNKDEYHVCAWSSDLGLDDAPVMKKFKKMCDKRLKRLKKENKVLAKELREWRGLSDD